LFQRQTFGALKSTTAHHRIQKFSNDGDFILLWGGFGSNPGEFSFPVDVALSPDGQEVYVADYGNQRVQRFSNNGIFLSSWNGGNQTFGGPQGVEVDSFGNVYVVDLSYSTIQKFSATGSFICSWGSPVELNQPLDVSASTTGLFYVPNYEKITVYGEAPTPATPTTWSAIKAQYK
jgi:DNA-binding beta-propeller fold protein YncE